MQRGRDERQNLSGGFGDPFAGFGGSPFGGSLISNMLGGRDPFDDPFFTQPFGGMMGPNMFGPSMFGPSMFGPGRGGFFAENSNAFENRAPLPPNRSRGPVIEEIPSDGEEEDDERRANRRKHSRPFVEGPDDEIEERKSKSMQLRPQSQSFSYHSSSVTYGGVNGAYYTASKTRKRGGDGVVFEESKEADSTTGKATHQVLRGIHDKGHTLTRKLDSDGRVDSLQTLHNLNQDELSGFDHKWKGKARQNLPGYDPGFDLLNGENDEGHRGWALPSTVPKKNV